MAILSWNEPAISRDLNLNSASSATWRIIPLNKWLGLPPPHLKAMKGYLKGEQLYLGDLITMLINHLLTGMILVIPSLKIIPA